MFVQTLAASSPDYNEPTRAINQVRRAETIIAKTGT
jgi:hypothetical protein